MRNKEQQTIFRRPLGSLTCFFYSRRGQSKHYHDSPPTTRHTNKHRPTANRRTLERRAPSHDSLLKDVLIEQSEREKTHASVHISCWRYTKKESYCKRIYQRARRVLTKCTRRTREANRSTDPYTPLCSPLSQGQRQNKNKKEKKKRWTDNLPMTKTMTPRAM